MTSRNILTRVDPWLIACLVLCAGLIAALQISGGAYRAEFDGYPDEAAHFVSGLLIHDYMVTRPPGDPVEWAVRYYLHYPKVAIGHWPPLWHVTETTWWLVFPPSRWSILLLNALLALTAATLLFRLGRTLTAPAVALVGALLVLAAPVTQQAFDLTMGDLPCLLWTVLLIQATARLLEQPSPKALGLTALWLVCALLTKGTGAALVPVPLLAIVMVGGAALRQIRLRWWLGAVAAVLAVGLGWYGIEALVLKHNLFRSGGVVFTIPWPVLLFPGLAGVGFLTLAGGAVVAAFVRRKPVAVASAAVLLSTAAVSYFLRAMNESRHVILVLPAIVLLAMEFLTWMETRTKWALLLALPALALFPFTLYRQQPAGYSRLLAQLHLPARMLISANAVGEGGWVTEVALAEKRPASVVVRATKALASSDWAGGHYRLETQTVTQVENRLDELGIEIVIVQATPAEQALPPQELPHQALVQQMIRESPTWRLCASESALSAYCRALPPQVPRKPLEIDLRGRLGRVIEE